MFSNSPLIFAFAALSIVTGAFMPFLLLMMIVLVHELGHTFCALILKVPIDKIYLYPFGGVSKFKSKINIPLRQEALILIMGPLAQLLLLLLLKSHLPIQYQEMVVIYNINILVFNLLPIYPLDGGKLLNILFSYHFSYRKSLSISLLFSCFNLLLLFLFLLRDIKLNIFLLLCLLIFKVYEEYKKRNYYQEKFLLERYLENNHFKRWNRVGEVSEFKRDCRHIVKGKNRDYTEKEVLSKNFNH